jgi:hypothetical protein
MANTMNLIIVVVPSTRADRAREEDLHDSDCALLKDELRQRLELLLVLCESRYVKDSRL